MKKDNDLKIGWIYPDGKVKFINDLYRHFSELFKDKEALAYLETQGWYSYERLKEWVEERYSDAYSDFVDQMEPDEHPCWHNFTCDTEDIIADGVYEAGFIRFGSYRNNKGEIEAETESNVLPNEKYVRDLMALVNAGLCVCRDRSYYHTKTKKYRKND